MPQYKLLFTDDAATTLAAGIVAASTSLQVVSGGGALFPALGASQAFIATLIKNGNPAIKEVIRVAGRSGDNFTSITRNFSGTGALTWNAGDTVAMLQPAEMMSLFLQGIDVQTGVLNYAQDVGSANAYQAILTPLPNSRVLGTPVVFFTQHANTGPSTLNDGIGTVNLLTADGEALRQNDLQLFSIVVAYFDGSSYRVVGLHHSAFSQLNGSIANAQVPVGAVIQWESALIIAFSQLTGTILQAQIPANLNLPGVPTAPTAAIGTSSLQLATAAFVNPSSVLGSFRKQPDGNIDQWGLCNPNGGTISVTFPVAFPSVCDGIVFGQISSGPTQVYTPPGTVSRTGFQVANTGGQTYWRARGH